jgi:hypothetical protein
MKILEECYLFNQKGDKIIMITRSPIVRFSFFFILALTALFQVSSLEAASCNCGWGTTGKTLKFEGTDWDEIYFNMNGLDFQALIPGYDSAMIEEETIGLSGFLSDGKGNAFVYLINTTMNPTIDAPDTEAEFVEFVKQAFDTHNVKAVSPKKFGAKYVVDLTPKVSTATDNWRILCTKDRLIMKVTNDPNAKRRANFFDNIRIK